MKPKFIKEGKEIFFQDRNGAKWSANCVDDAFKIAQMFKKIVEYSEHYASERVDNKNFYEELYNEN